MSNGGTSYHGDEIAIIGMAGRFPGAADLDTFWENLRAGSESIAFFSEQELRAAGVDRALLSNPRYVRAQGVLADVELFDAAFFGYTPREAEIMDPQQRLFLECAWEAIEHAGYDAERCAERIGVFAGVGTNSYLLNLYSNPEVIGLAGHFQIGLGNNKDHLTTRVSYKLNLRGPSVNVQTGCSTSLVAVHLACQSLLNGECELALAGGVAISVPQRRGYLYQEGGIESPDGHCRAFDAGAQGTVSGSGVGIVVLRRLADALAGGDAVHAVIKGSAINNDGAAKAGYTAPGIPGQAEVIAEALALARVAPETIGYVEAHGTATPLGDPVEIAALTRAFRGGAGGSCAIGSVKTNIGHLDAAAGVASLIKTVLALKHGQIPPSLHFEQPNPRIDFARSPFYVNAALAEWPVGPTPRRAGVSSFGIGGTNAHLVLEEAPLSMPTPAPRPWHLLILSAKTEAALEAAAANLAAYLADSSPREGEGETSEAQRAGWRGGEGAAAGSNLADIAYTLQVGRRAFGCRRALVCRDAAEAASALAAGAPDGALAAWEGPGARPVAFLFPGQGAQHVGMARDLYDHEPVFRAEVDRCAEVLKPHLGLDLRDVIYPDPARMEDGGWRMEDGESAILHPPSSILNETQYTQPALFAVEYALAQLWMSWGIRPQALIGHSVGEYVAACLAGVFSLEDALALVAARGRMMQQLPGGAMLGVALPEGELRPLLGPQLDIAAINAPAQCVASGPAAALEALEHRLAERGVECRRLHTSHAFHSAMIDPILEPFAELVGRVPLKPPALPYLSSVTGTWITDAQATDPRYWAGQLRRPVRFADGVRELAGNPGRVLLEVGPGQGLSTLARGQAAGQPVLASLGHPRDQRSDVMVVLGALGRLWCAGVEVSWREFAGAGRRRLPLPTYPFDRRRYWVEPRVQAAGDRPAALHKRADIADWFYVPSWKRSPAITTRPGGEGRCWLVFIDACGLGAAVVERLERAGHEVRVVTAGERFASHDRAYALDPRRREDYDALLADLRAQDWTPQSVAHLWGVVPDNQESADDAFEPAQDRGLYSLLFLTQALDAQRIRTPLELAVITSQAQAVSGAELIRPERATALGPCLVIPQEHPHIGCRCIDIELPNSSARLVDQLFVELTAGAPDRVVAYRGKHRWVQIYEPSRLPVATESTKSTEGQNGSTPSVAETRLERRSRIREATRNHANKDTDLRVPSRSFADVAKTRLREGGVYLITGGLGGLGLELARELAQVAQAKLILVGRSALPERADWDAWLATHDDGHPTALKLRAIQALEAQGAQVMVAAADVADVARMRQVLAQASERFGPLNGVIHAAGWTGERSLSAVQETGRAACEGHLRPKAYGLIALEQALGGQDLDFCLLFSSLASQLGGLGYAAYAAANLFLDAFAHARGAPWISINWDGWQRAASLRHSGAELAIAPDEGIACLRRILGAEGEAQIIVSTGDLQARLAQWVRREGWQEEKQPRSAGKLVLHARPALRESYVAPGNAVEQTIAGIWQQVLGVEPVGVHDNFFELGGHSLLATQLISRVRDALQAELPLRSLFETPTVAGLAAWIGQGGDAADQAPPLRPALREGALPLSFAQQRLWFLDQMEPNSPTYNVPTAVRLTGALDIAAFARTLAAIVGRHEVLRTTFAVVDRQPVQVIGSVEIQARGEAGRALHEAPLPIVDLGGLPEGEREPAARRLAQEEARRPFDLARGPLLRTALLRLRGAEHVLLLTMHHIVSDGWSMGIFVRELAAIYAADVTGRPADLPALPVQYADYAVWQRAWLQGEGDHGGSPLQAQIAYWRRRLADMPALLLPTDRSRPPVATSRGASERFALPKEPSAELAALGRAEGATAFMTSLAGFLVVLHYHTGQDDIVIGTDVANRTRGETEGLIGFFVNQLVLRADLAGNPTFRELLGRVREVVLGASAHQDLPFDKLVEVLNPARDPGRHPLFQVKFVFQNAPAPAVGLPDLTVSPLEVEDHTARFDISVLLDDTAQGLSGKLEYNSDLFDGATMARLLDNFATVLRAVAAQPELDLGRLGALLAEADRQRRIASGRQFEAASQQKLKTVRRKAVPVTVDKEEVS